jgi:hypothetical protein
MVRVREGTFQWFGDRHWPAHSKLIGKCQPGFPQGHPAQFGLMIECQLRVKKAAFSLGAKCREGMTVDFGYVRHVSKLLRKLIAPGRKSAPAASETLPN